MGGAGEQQLKNIILVGPGGSLGSFLLGSLLSEPSFNISVLARQSSNALKSLPRDRLSRVHEVSDDYPYQKLVEALQGQDAVVNAITSTEAGEQFKFIDAAIEAKVKRYVPSEYGLNYSRPEARAMNYVFDGKGKVRDYLREKEKQGLTWCTIDCGIWIEWSPKNNFSGLDYAHKTMTFIDDGHGKFSTSTMFNTGLALNRALLNPELTKNQYLYISDFATTQIELLSIFEKVTDKKWAVKHKQSDEIVESANKKLEQGDDAAIYELIEVGFISGKYGAWLEEKEQLWNEALGLPKVKIEDVVRDALKKVET